MYLLVIDPAFSEMYVEAQLYAWADERSSKRSNVEKLKNGNGEKNGGFHDGAVMEPIRTLNY